VSNMNFLNITIVELKQICRAHKIKGFTKKTKEQLIKMIEQREASMPPPMDKSERVKRLKEHLSASRIDHEYGIMQAPTFKDAHVYCIVNKISGQKYGGLLEMYFRMKFGYQKNNAKDCTGDCSKDGKNSEIKVSLGGGKHLKFNYVQIRPNHDCDFYILTAFSLTDENVEEEGELYIFRVPKEEVKKLVVAYGGYAHGTNKEHGAITISKMENENNNCEYALRPVINSECWEQLMQYRITESSL